MAQILRNVGYFTGELNRPRQSHAQVHGGSHEGSSRPQLGLYSHRLLAFGGHPASIVPVAYSS